jgi:hypothetical protein
MDRTKTAKKVLAIEPSQARFWGMRHKTMIF